MTTGFALLGRLLIAISLIIQGVYSTMEFSSLTESLKNVQYIEALLMIVIILEFIAAALILLGWLARFAGVVLLASVIIATWVGVVSSRHLFEQQSLMLTLTHYANAIFYVGFAFYLIAFGAGQCGFDRLRNRYKTPSK